MHAKLELEYNQINENIRFLADVRFKLLAIVPALGGTAVFVLTRAGLQGALGPVSSSSELLAVIVVSVFGLLATLGITLYDQRNSELYNALIHRAKHLEQEFGVPSTPGGLTKLPLGGQFRERPAKHRKLVFVAGHDLGLALIYGPLLGAWFFPLTYVVARLFEISNGTAQGIGALVALIAAVGSAARLIAIDNHDRVLYNEAAERDYHPEESGEMRDLLSERYTVPDQHGEEAAAGHVSDRSPEKEMSEFEEPDLG